MEILVGYASVAGSTKEVAAHVAARLAERGSTVTCVPIGTSLDPAGFDAVVVGSAVHGQAWLPEAMDWLRTSRHVLAGRPVWAFSVGMPAAVGRPFRRLALHEGPKIATTLGELIQLRGHRCSPVS
jgi:menaquinone-dependent protoporphyrinogen oxidase